MLEAREVLAEGGPVGIELEMVVACLVSSLDGDEAAVLNRVLQSKATPNPTEAVAMLTASWSSSSSIASSRIRNFWTLPVTVIGNEPTSFQ